MRRGAGPGRGMEEARTYRQDARHAATGRTLAGRTSVFFGGLLGSIYHYRDIVTVENKFRRGGGVKY